jgi:ankyrin repeat protein
MERPVTTMSDRPSAEQASSHDIDPRFRDEALCESAEHWLQHALHRHDWHPGDKPQVMISFSKENYKWVKKLRHFLDSELEFELCPRTGEPYSVYDFADLKLGTKAGRRFPTQLTEAVWRSRAAIIFWSQAYCRSKWCMIELKCLMWRHLVHKIPIFLVKLGPVTADFEIIEVPPLTQRFEPFDLAQLPSDMNPAGNSSAARKFAMAHLPSVRNPHELDRRLNDFAQTIRSRLRVPAIPSSPLKLDMHSPPEAVLEGVFPEIAKFHGRGRQLHELSANIHEDGAGVIGIIEQGGIGKTSLVRHWLSAPEHRSAQQRFRIRFGFSFYHGRTEQDFLTAFWDLVEKELSIPSGLQNGSIEDLIAVLEAQPILLFLDGVEEIQDVGYADDHGRFLSDSPVREILTALCSNSDVASVAIVTSRVPFADLQRFHGNRFIQISLPGMSAREGAAFLDALRVPAGEDERFEYSRQLGGHPLDLRIFATSIRNEPMAFGNAADRVARAVRLADPGTAAEKRKRILEYYHQHLDAFTANIIAIVALFPGGATSDTIVKLVAQEDLDEMSRAGGRPAIIKRIDQLIRDDILQEQKGTYTCHPLIREEFRPRSGKLADSVVRLLVQGRPLRFVPRTLAEAEPYLRAIIIYTEKGQFREASTILGRHLRWNDVLIDILAYREALYCWMQFLGDTRRADCEKELGRPWLTANLPRVTQLCIDMNEWDAAEKFAALDLHLLPDADQAARSSNALLRAQIAQEVGSIREAREAYLTAIDDRVLSSQNILPLLAEAERASGRSRSALDLVDRWRRGLSSSSVLADWLSAFDHALLTVSRVLVRHDPAEAQRYLQARGKVQPLSAAQRESLARFTEFETLSLKPRDARTEDDWKRLRALAEALGSEADQRNVKGAGNGWRHVIVEALNGLGEPDKARSLGLRVFEQLHPRSWRRLWLRAEMARARLLLGDAAQAIRDAAAIIREARRGDRLLLARDPAELILAAADQAPDPSFIEEARQVLSEIEDLRDLPPGYVPDLGPLPGEPEWDTHLTTLLLDARTGPADALVEAAALGLVGAAQILLSQGASIGSEQLSAAYRDALGQGHYPVMRLLAENGAPFDLRSQDNQQAVLLAVQAGHVEAVRLFLDHENVEGAALSWLLVNAAGSGNEPVARILVEKGADIDETADGLHPLVAAVRSGEIALVEFLADRLPSVNSADRDGETALMAASNRGVMPVLEFLLRRGADVEATDQAGRTALDYAAAAGNSEAVQLLLTRSSNREAGTGLQRALVDAALNGRTDVVRFLAGLASQ